MCLLAAGCASHEKAPTAPKPEETLAKISAGGYRSARSAAVSEEQEDWYQGDVRIGVAVLAPKDMAAGERFPLVVYLPGLGEPVGAAVLWRKAWAAAGYIVIALQPDGTGPVLWTTPRAYAGDFKGLAQEQYAPSTMATRLGYVRFVIDEARRRAARGIAPYAAADLARVVLAGFDFGAQTAAAAAADEGGAVGIRGLSAVLLLSPYVSLNEALNRDYAGIGVPALTVTGARDSDPFSMPNSAPTRAAAWQAMPAGDKYRLALADGSHSMIAGAGLLEPEAGARFMKDGIEQKPSIWSRMTSGFNKDSKNSKNKDQQGNDIPAGPQMFDLAQVAAVQGVSTAFLDAEVKQDARARQWLAGDAARWLGRSAALDVR